MIKILGNILFIILLPLSFVMFIVFCVGVALNMGATEYFKLYNHVPEN